MGPDTNYNHSSCSLAAVCVFMFCFPPPYVFLYFALKVGMVVVIMMNCRINPLYMDTPEL